MTAAIGLLAVCFARGVSVAQDEAAPTTAPTATQQASTLRMATPFGDHMVLQRDLPVNVWGTAPAGADVSVTIASAAINAKADSSGKWSAALPPMPAGGPYVLHVSGGGNSVEIKDVLIGEVWLCSGQSNMAWTMQNFKDRSDPTFGNDIDAADDPMIRLGSVALRVKFDPATDTPVRWSVASPESAAKYSATAYFFARALRKKLGVPVGVMNASWGGTPAEAWTDRATLDSDPVFKPALRRLEMYADLYPKLLADWEKRVAAVKNDPSNPPMPQKPRPYDKNSHLPTTMWNGKINPLVPMTFRGVAWYQGEADGTRGQPGLYSKLLPAMFKAWRTAFGRGDDLKLLIVQLPGYGVDRAGLQGSYWAQIREVQAKTAATLKNAALCITLDLGLVDNQHPPTKRQVGSRLAALATAPTAGIDSSVAPRFARADFNSGHATLRFENGGALVLKDAPASSDFLVAGKDRIWHVASVVRDGDTLVLQSKEVPEPVAARYAWSDSPHATLADTVGLPMAPFRTDTWPLLADRRPSTRPANDASDDTP